MNKYRIRFHYTLSDLFGDALILDQTTFKEVCEDFDINKDLTFLFDNEGKSKKYLEQLWTMILNQYGEHYCLGTENAFESPYSTEDKKIIRGFVRKVISILMATYDRYSTLLSLYEANTQKLMNPLKSTNKNVMRFNDTPQNEEENDEFENDAHVSNLTTNKSESEIDNSTTMARLKEIQENYNQTFDKWLKEFDPLFVDEGGIR